MRSAAHIPSRGVVLPVYNANQFLGDGSTAFLVTILNSSLVRKQNGK
jgi:hypothetical protein